MARIRLGRLVSCAKITYATNVDALIAMKASEIRHSQVDGKVPVRAYRCRRCSRWHLTSRAA